jgi:hypothetical protein
MRSVSSTNQKRPWGPSSRSTRPSSIYIRMNTVPETRAAPSRVETPLSMHVIPVHTDYYNIIILPGCGIS